MTYSRRMRNLQSLIEKQRAELAELAAADPPLVRTALLWCPFCRKQHIDEGVWRTKPHRTHRCVDDADGKGCGREWTLDERIFGVRIEMPAAEPTDEELEEEAHGVSEAILRGLVHYEPSGEERVERAR